MGNPSFKKSLLVTSLASFITVSAAEAAPGTLSQSPLFLANRVKSNILFVLDDSGSMDWEVLKNTGAEDAHSVSSGYPNSGDIDLTPDGGAEALELCPGYNTLAYNPNVTYTPWVGKDSAGNTYGDMTLATARSNPYYTAITNISTAVYFNWTDSDGDGKYDLGECPIPSSYPVDSAVKCNAVTGTSCVWVGNLTAAEQKNFANWWTYYRKREYVMKRAVSELVNDSGNRVGMATLHNNGTVSTPVADLASGTNRATLLNKLFQEYSSGGTPLRDALNEAGQYFHMDDGQSHQYFSAAASPILPLASGGACQQNFNIVMSDGYWNGTTPNPWGNEDGDGNTAWDGGAMADSWSNTLADTAMHYYETDLSSALPNKVPTMTGIDENDAQHLTTFTVAFGLSGTITADPPDRTTAFLWPNPIDLEDEHRIDDMRHAAFNGRGEFLSAKDPQELISSLNAAISAIDARTGSASSVSFNTSQLTANTVVYRAKFNSTRWSGSLEALPLDPITGAVSPTAVWNAANVLDAQSSRVILTHDGTDGVPFTWAEVNDATSPITVALNDLKSNNAGGSITDPTGAETQARLNYLRGDRSNEGTGYFFRLRSTRLGDIVHSSPVYVGSPQMDWPDAAPFPATTGSLYSEYVTAQQSRPGVVYVGANDGMLHGFSGSNGREVMAYIPRALFSSATNEGMHYLARTDYLHRYYVDLDPTLSDVYIKTSPTGTPAWRTVLVGGLRGGGRGLYALNVTNPAAFSEGSAAAADTVLWEFSSANDTDLGYTFSRPTIALMNNGKWAAILGNGYNDLGSGQAKLFILFLEAGLDGWVATDYVKITTGVGDTTNRNGLATPAVADLDGNGTADRIYAGDLTGRMWAFDVSSTNTGSWASAYKTGSTPSPLFISPANQPITAKPVLSLHPTEPLTSQNAPNVMVYFGTGQYLTDGDKSTTYTQTLYGVWDMGTKALTQTNLVQQTFDPNFPNYTVLTSNPVDYTGTAKGWYVNLPVSGERMITTPIIRDGIVYATTLVPVSDPCSYGTDGYLMAMDMTTGGTPDRPVFDTNNDGVVNAADYAQYNGDNYAQSRRQVGGGLADPKTLGDNIYISDPSGDLRRIKLPPIGGSNTGRLSWQELLAK